MPTLNQLKAIVTPLLDTGISMELISSPGIGKSDFVVDLVAERTETTGVKWGFSQAFLATYTPPDLVGYQFKGERMWKDPHTGKMGPVAVTDPSLPLWMMSVEGKPLYEYERGILFLDEFGQGEADVKRAAAQLLLKGEIGPWKLPKGWTVIAASNRAKDRSGVTKSFDFVINRRIEFHIDADLNSWDQWAITRGIDPLFVAFAHQHPDIVFGGSVPKEQGPWCTPRSLVMAHDALRALSSGHAHLRMDPTAMEVLAGAIGAAAAAQVKSFIELSIELPSYEEIIADPLKARLPEKADAQMLSCFQLAHGAEEDDFGAVVKYVGRLGAEFEVMFVRRLLGRKRTYVQHKAISPLVTKHTALIVSIGNA